MTRASEIYSLGRAAGGDERNLTLRNAQSEQPGLYVVATPIGNAQDVTLRALQVLRTCDLIVAEDTRITAKLLAIHGISKPLSPYNDHNAARERPRLLARLRGGQRVALVSDAGTPLISDPGYKLVREALVGEVAVYAVPGPSAALTALTLAGLPTDRFMFVGFLPSKAGARRRALEDVRSVPATLVFFESPRRLAECLQDMAAILGNREAAVCRELTKLHEEVRRADLDFLASEFQAGAPPKGEITVVVGAPRATGPDFHKAEMLLVKALAHMPVNAAADLVAAACDLPKRAMYERALALKNDDEA
jgi:16S rRNA (cytidine1402-2'-O)-methyltransferase